MPESPLQLPPGLLCPACGYDLAGMVRCNGDAQAGRTEVGRCPECGGIISAEDLEGFARRPSMVRSAERARRVLVLGTVIAGGVLSVAARVLDLAAPGATPRMIAAGRAGSLRWFEFGYPLLASVAFTLGPMVMAWAVIRLHVRASDRACWLAVWTGGYRWVLGSAWAAIVMPFMVFWATAVMGTSPHTNWLAAAMLLVVTVGVGTAVLGVACIVQSARRIARWRGSTRLERRAEVSVLLIMVGALWIAIGWIATCAASVMAIDRGAGLHRLNMQP